MRFLDQFGKAAHQAVDRARFEAEKFQKTSRIQGELSEIKRNLDQQLIALGERTCDLYRTGQINPSSVADLVQEIDRLRVEVTRKEDVLRQAQAEAYVEPPEESSGTAAEPGAQSVPVEDKPAPPPPTFHGQQRPAQEAPPPETPAAPRAPLGPSPEPDADSQPAQESPPPSQPASFGLPPAPEPPAAPAAEPAQRAVPAGKKPCPACGFHMPAHAVFCPNCGFRVGTSPLT
jgi:hypothetical protein